MKLSIYLAHQVLINGKLDHGQYNEYIPMLMQVKQIVELISSKLALD